MRLAPADGPLLERILDATYPVWNEGLTRRAYGQWNTAQLMTPWGRQNLHRFALLDAGGRLLSTAKRYRYGARLDGRDGFIAGIGAVFTPPAERGRGYATEIIERLVEQERQAGALAAALFSEIGPEFYQRRGFNPVPLDEVTVNVTLKDGAPAMLVRAGDDRDFAEVAAMDAARSAGARFSLQRSVPLIQYAISKKRIQAGVGPPGLRQLEFFVAEEGASAVAYVVLSVTRSGWTIEEAGDRDPAGARLGAMLQVLAARDPTRPLPLVRTWWPRSFPVPPQWRLTDRTDMRDLLMIRPFVELSAPISADDVFYWRSDYF